MSTTITTPGLVTDMDEATYHSDPVAGGSLSYSTAKALVEPGGPARWWHQHRHPQPHKKAFDLGTAAHALVLGVGAETVTIPASLLAKNGAATTTEAKAFVEQVRAEGKTPLKPDEYLQVRQMAMQLSAHPTAVKTLTGQHEVSAFAKTGDVWLRGRLDTLSGTGIADYKTTVSAAPEAWAKTVWDRRYHMQAAHYTDLVHLLTGERLPFRFVVQEKEPPYLVAVYELDQQALDHGADLMTQAATIWRQCRRSGYWPGYDTDTITVGLPAWVARSLPTSLDPELEAELLALMAQTKEPNHG